MTETADGELRYLTLDVVGKAVQDLRGSARRPRLNKHDRTVFLHWLFLKWKIVNDDGEILPMEGSDTSRFQEEWFEINCPGVTPGSDSAVPDRGVFDPFQHSYYYRSGRTAWSSQTLWTGLKPNRQSDPSKEAIEVEDAEDGRFVRLRPGGIEAVKRRVAEKFDVSSLAVWRYRHTPIPVGTTAEDLLRWLIADLGISEEEFEALFPNQSRDRLFSIDG